MGGRWWAQENGAITRSGVDRGRGCFACLSTGAVISQEHGCFKCWEMKIMLHAESEEDHCLELKCP